MAIALQVSVLEPKFSSDFRNQKTEMLKMYLYLYIFILKCYQTAIKYMNNVTLSLVVTSRHDMKLTRPISGFMQKYSSRQHQERFNEIEYICQYVSHRIKDQNIILSSSAFTPSFSTTHYMVDLFTPYAQLPSSKAFHHTVS